MWMEETLLGVSAIQFSDAWEKTLLGAQSSKCNHLRTTNQFAHCSHNYFWQNAVLQCIKTLADRQPQKILRLFLTVKIIARTYTPLKTNMEPQNEGLENDVPFQTAVFQFPVNFRGIYMYII